MNRLIACLHCRAMVAWVICMMGALLSDHHCSPGVNNKQHLDHQSKCKSDAYQFGPDTKTTVMVRTCDAKGRYAHNKNHTTYDNDGNPTQRTSKNEMAWQTEKWHAHLWHQPRDGHWQKTLGCHGEKRRHHPDGRRRKWLVTVSNCSPGVRGGAIAATVRKLLTLVLLVSYAYIYVCKI